MANPEVAMAFQNPRVQAAIMDVSVARLFRFCTKLESVMMLTKTLKTKFQKKMMQLAS